MHGFVRDILEHKGSHVFTIVPGVTVREAVRLMNEHGVGAVLVTTGDMPVGIFTERDVLKRVVDPGLDPDTTRVAAVMTGELVTVKPGMAVEEAMSIITNRRCRHLPVVEDGRLVGLISIGDVMRRVSVSQQSEIQHLVEYIRGPAAE